MSDSFTLVLSGLIIFVLAGLLVQSLLKGPASGFDRRSPDFSALINDGDNRIFIFLRPKGQRPSTVRRPCQNS